MTFARSIDFLIRNGAACAHSSRNDTTYYVAHGIRLGPQAAGSMSLTNGSGTWSTLARWCGRYLPYLRRSAARSSLISRAAGDSAPVVTVWTDRIRCSGQPA